MADHDDDGLSELARAAAESDEDAFRELVGRAAPVVYGLARSLLRDDTEAQDVVQETAIRVWQKLPELRDHRAVLGWICRIARNQCTDRLRSRGRRPTEVRSPASLDGFADAIARAAKSPPRPDQLAEYAETRRMVHALIDELAPRYRTVFVMRVVEEMSAKEIADALGCAVGTVEARLSRGRRLLARALRRRQLLGATAGGGER